MHILRVTLVSVVVLLLQLQIFKAFTRTQTQPKSQAATIFEHSPVRRIRFRNAGAAQAAVGKDHLRRAHVGNTRSRHRTNGRLVKGTQPTPNSPNCEERRHISRTKVYLKGQGT